MQAFLNKQSNDNLRANRTLYESEKADDQAETYAIRSIVCQFAQPRLRGTANQGKKLMMSTAFYVFLNMF
ncbi:MAG: hypothetical protein NVSMB6_21370 [Burkholderiaceae bacterium]